MIKVIDQYLATSLKEFLNYRTLVDLQAFKTVTGQLYQYSPKWYGNSALGSSYASWVYDASIPGATVPTSLSGVSGAIPDYKNGRFIIPTGTSYTGLSCEFSVNEINYYVSSSSESKLIFETNFERGPDYVTGNTYFPPESIVVPAVFVKSYQTESEELCLGGVVDSQWNFKIVALAQSESQLLGIQKVVRDSRGEIFPIMGYSALGKYNNVQFSNWNYPAEMAEPQNYAYITDSTFKIQENDLIADKNADLYIGIGNIEVSFQGMPRTNPPNFDVYLLSLQDNSIVSTESDALLKL